MQAIGGFIFRCPVAIRLVRRPFPPTSATPSAGRSRPMRRRRRRSPKRRWCKPISWFPPVSHYAQRRRQTPPARSPESPCAWKAARNSLSLGFRDLWRRDNRNCDIRCRKDGHGHLPSQEPGELLRRDPQCLSCDDAPKLRNHETSKLSKRPKPENQNQKPETLQLTSLQPKW